MPGRSARRDVPGLSAMISSEAERMLTRALHARLLEMNRTALPLSQQKKAAGMQLPLTGYNCYNSGEKQSAFMA